LTQALYQQLMQELDSALQGRWQHSESIIAPAMPNSSITEMLQRLQTNPYQQHPDAPFPVFAETSTGKATSPWPSHWHDWLNTKSPWASWSIDNAPPIIIEIGTQYDSFCSRQCQAITHIYLNANESIDHAYAHELTHGLSWSGNRFLDEGLALWCEKTLCKSLRHTTQTEHPVAESMHVYRELFFRHGKAGKYLTSHDNDDATYAAALACFEHILQEIPIEKIQSVFKQLATLPSPNEQWYTLITMADAWHEQDNTRPARPISSSELHALTTQCRASFQLSPDFEQALHQLQLSVHRQASSEKLGKPVNDMPLAPNNQRITLLSLLTLKAKISASIRKPVDWGLIKSIQHHLHALGEHSDPRLALIRVKYYLALLMWRVGDHLSQTEKNLKNSIALALNHPADQHETLMEKASIEFYYFKQGKLPQQQCIATLNKIPPESDFHQEALNFAHYQKLAL